jgi:two-component system nitrate/nitrite response regulator NarL
MSQSGAPIRVVIADSHPLYRESLARLIRQRPGFDLVAQCRNGRDALAAIKAEAPDVALLAVQLPDLDGIEILEDLRASGHSSTPILMLSGHHDGPTVYASIAAGARGYLLKDADRGEITAAVLAVAAGGTVLPAGLHGGLADEIRNRADPRHSPLTPRETDVLRSTAGGQSAREIAEQLIISTATVKTHLRHIYDKLEVSDRAAAVAEAMRRGFLD